MLRCVPFPSYVLARIVLHKHMDISKNDRKTKAIARVDRLCYTGDPHTFQVEAVTALNEYFNADTKPIDFALSRLMKAFEGKSQATQHKIAADMNGLDITEQNIFDLVQKYCADLASVGSSTNSVNMLDDVEAQINAVICSFCKALGHSEPECRRKKKAHLKCTHCGKQYHTAAECFTRNKEERSAAGGTTPPPHNQANMVSQLLQQQQAPDACNNTQAAPSQGMSHEAVAALLQQLSGRCNHVTEPQQQSQQQQFTVDQLASLMITSQRPMTAEEQNRSMAQANNPSSASFLWPVQHATQCLALQSVM